MTRIWGQTWSMAGISCSSNKRPVSALTFQATLTRHANSTIIPSFILHHDMRTYVVDIINVIYNEENMPFIIIL